MKYLRRFLFAGFLGVAVVATVRAGEPRQTTSPELSSTLSSEDRAHLEKDTFTPIKRIHDLPVPVARAMAKSVLYGEMPEKAMAEPGAPWQATDAGDGQHLPMRRLIWAAIAPDLCVVHHERGGRGHADYLLLFKLTRDKQGKITNAEPTANLWVRPFMDMTQLQTVLKSGKFADYQLPRKG